MAIRWYVAPVERVDLGGKIIRRPQYLLTINPAVAWGWMEVMDDWCVIWADLNATDHATYNGSSGVTFLTANLNNTLSAGAVVQLVAALDTRNLPSSWVSTSVTWHDAIKRILCYFMQIKRYWGETRDSLNVGVPKITVVGTLSQTVQEKLAVVATTLGLSSVNPLDTVEQTMERWADELIVHPIMVGGIQL